MMTPYGIIEMARTGMVTLQKGSEAITNKKIRYVRGDFIINAALVVCQVNTLHIKN